MQPNLSARRNSYHSAPKDKSVARAPSRRCWHIAFCLLLAWPQTARVYADTSEQQTLPADTHAVNIPRRYPVSTRSMPGPVITAEYGVYTIFDMQGREHAFVQQPDGRFRPQGRNSGALDQAAKGQFRWTRPSGEHLRFRISIPALSSIGECAPSSPVPNSEDVPDNATPSDSTDVKSPQPDQAPLQSPQSDDAQQCGQGATEPHTFQPNPYSGRQTTLDARPASCESYFVQYYGTRRGSAIESGLHRHEPYNGMQSTIRTFPIIDFIDDSTLYVIHSRDLGNRTFNSPSRPNALFDQLMDDGEDIQTRFVDVLLEQGSISASERGQTTTITVDQLRPITLQLVIRDGMASADHWAQIELAQEQLMRLYGITLEVVIIP